MENNSQIPFHYTLHFFANISINNSSNKNFKIQSINEFKAQQVHFTAVTNYSW